MDTEERDMEILALFNKCFVSDMSMYNTMRIAYEEGYKVGYRESKEEDYQ